MVGIAVPVLLVAVALSACGEVGVAKESAGATSAPDPLPAPRVYRSADKNLTFPTPVASFYCPLPEGWVGSDHGTVVFLISPKRCGRAGGVPSSERGALNAPNIQVYYGYDVLEEDQKQPRAPCETVGEARFLGGDRPLCIVRHGSGVVEVRAEASYMAEGAEQDLKAEAAFTLVTDSGRLRTDLAVFKTLLEQTGTCNRTDGVDEPSYPNDRPDCAPDALWF